MVGSAQSPPEDLASGLWDTPIVVAATPIGNLSDATQRLRDLLASAEIIAAEDTRRTRHLCRALGVGAVGRFLSFHEHNEASRTEQLISAAGDGTRVLVVSDAGMPTVSDPGFRLVAAAITAEVGVTVAPGASAVTTALALSGLPTDQFSFAGFVPRRASEKRRLLQRLAVEDWTTVLFDSPHRVDATLSEFSRTLGPDRPAALCRELTKRHEEVLRGTVEELAGITAQRRAQGRLRGEMVLVLGGADDVETPAPEDLADAVLQRTEAGAKLRSAAKAVAAEYGLGSRELYEAALARRSDR